MIDRENVGFISSRCAGSVSDAPADSTSPPLERDCVPSERGWLYDTAERGNGNGGHLYGLDLSEDEKNALIEYLKTF